MIVWDLVEDEQAFTHIRDEWSDAHKRSLRPEPFQSSAFILAWLRANPTQAKPMIIVGRDEKGHLVAGYPLMVRREKFLGVRQRTLVPMGSPLLDYSDPLLLEEGYARPLADHLIELGRRNADVIMIDNHRRNSAFARALTQCGFSTSPAVACYSRVIDTSDDQKHEPGTIVLGDTSRRMMKGKINRLHRLGQVKFRYAATEAEAYDMLDHLFAFHITRWASTTTPSMYTDPAYKSWYRELVHTGLRTNDVMVGCLTVNDQTVGVHFGLRHQQTLIWTTPSMNSAFSKLSPGLLLAYYTLATAHEYNIHVVDFSRGGEEYKKQFCDIIEWNDTSKLALSYSARLLLWLRSAARNLLGDSHPLRKYVVRST